MMYKLTAFLIAFSIAVLLSVPGLAFADAQAIENIAVDITFDGVYVQFEEHNFQILVPKAWLAYEADAAENIYYMAGNEAQTQFMWMKIFKTENYTMSSILDELLDNPNYRNVFGAYFNSIPFVCFEAIQTEVFGAITLSGDGSYIYFFNFHPIADAELGNLAIQIMASISLLFQ